MCGIAGLIGYRRDNLSSILNSLYHRGPDEQDFVRKGEVALLHTRLSIQDITHGHQPFSYEHFTIVFNGEIYNHLELRKKLDEFVFQTRSDTETLLYLYIKYKEKMFEYIDGMFAFAIYDEKEKKLFLARDRAGKKPLYYFKKGKEFIFASELNALRAFQRFDIDEDAVYSYLKSGFFYGEFTPFKDVKKLKASTFIEYDLNTATLKEKRYFDIKECYYRQKEISLDEALQKADEALLKSVKERLLSSDLEVGAFLSGGIDSSLIVAMASKYRDTLKTFTVKFQGSYDESHLAKLTAKRYETHHHELEISMDLKNDIEMILTNYGMPFMDSSAVPSYYVSREAKKYVTVILNGDGADEIFGGYRRYVPVANGWVEKAKYLSFLTKLLPKPHDKQSIYNFLYRLLTMSCKSGIDFYTSATADIFDDVYELPKTKVTKKMDLFIRQIEEDDKMTPLSKILYMDFNLLLFSNALIKIDIATMANSLEGRSPFLSRYMLEFAPTLPDVLKVNKTTTKYILRELAKKYLSPKLITQPKRGFEVPLKKWVESDLKENIFDLLSANAYSENYLPRTFIDDLLNDKLNVSKEKRAKMLWSLYSLEVWKKSL